MKHIKKYLFDENFVLVVKILAVGSYKRFAWFMINGRTFYAFISDDFYQELKKLGVPTCQSLRGKK